MKPLSKLLILMGFAGIQLSASVSVQLSAPTATIQFGQTLVITAAAKDTAATNTRFSYQFTVRPHNQGPWLVVQDFYFDDTFTWTPIDHEGVFDVGVTAWSQATRNTSPNYITVTVNSRVSGTQPVISNTNNELVALYSAPPCSAPATMRVQFHAPSTPVTYTPTKTCNGLSMNFYIGGMQANTTYSVQQLLTSGSGTTAGPQLNYTTGSIPSNVSIPNHFRLVGPQSPTSTTYPYLMHALTGYSPFAADLNENVVWYRTGGAPYDSGVMTRPVIGGTFLSIDDDPVNSKVVCKGLPAKACGDHQFLVEYDLAGNVIRKTSWAVMNDYVNELRAQQNRPLVRFNNVSHEGLRLPNGYTVTLLTNEQVKKLTSGTKDVFGDTVVVLDSHFFPVWAWDAFDHLDINRTTLPTTCAVGQLGCPQEFFQRQSNGQLYTQAEDWTHANSVYYDPTDGNLIVSFRHQSWAIKIAYQNGGGDGHIIWKLGYGGSFELASGYPVTDWFSGQHDVEFQANGLLTLFDNNNPSTLTQQPGGNAHGQVWKLDTTSMVATPVINIDLGVVSLAVGSATLLSNGNYEWQAGFIAGDEAQTFEFTPSGTLVYKQQTDALCYRVFRMPDLYTP